MELYDLEYGVKAVASGGNVLSCQELTSVQAGLSVLKCKEKYTSIYFWGKVFGSQADYYIAYGIKDYEEQFEFPAKQFYFANEDFVFKPLERLTEEVADRIVDLGLDTPFSGDPNKLIEPVAEGEEAEAAADEGEAVPEGPPKLKEFNRLSQVVQEIDFDTAVVPKGAHALNEAHAVVPSSSFKGLGLTEAKSLSKYVHFRQPTSVAALRALARTDVQFYSEFLDPLEADLPKGSWAVRQDPSIALVTLRSLSWPGYISFHVPGTTKYGGLYYGYGQRNRDLPFIL
jgi:radial spoke head protein 9